MLDIAETKNIYLLKDTSKNIEMCQKFACFPMIETLICTDIISRTKDTYRHTIHGAFHPSKTIIDPKAGSG
jgi:hypothetical protein